MRINRKNSLFFDAMNMACFIHRKFHLEVIPMAKSAFANFMKAFMVSAKAVPEDEIDKFVEDYTDDEHRIPTPKRSSSVLPNLPAVKVLYA